MQNTQYDVNGEMNFHDIWGFAARDLIPSSPKYGCPYSQFI